MWYSKGWEFTLVKLHPLQPPSPCLCGQSRIDYASTLISAPNAQQVLFSDAV